jgi:hypothetical protein
VAFNGATIQQDIKLVPPGGVLVVGDEIIAPTGGPRRHHGYSVPW